MNIEKINVGGTQYDVCDTVTRTAVSDEFSTGETYAAGDYCIYNNTLYKFTAAKSAGAWDGSKAEATQIGEELSQLNGNNVVQGNVIKIGGVVTIQRGVKTISLSTSEQDFEVEFPESFPNTPSVVFSIERFGYASDTFAVLKSRTAQKFTITARSGSSQNLGSTIVWVAVSPD